MEGASAASTVIGGATALSLRHRGAAAQKYKTAVTIRRAPPMRSLIVFFFMFHFLTSHPRHIHTQSDVSWDQSVAHALDTNTVGEGAVFTSEGRYSSFGLGRRWTSDGSQLE